MATTKSFLFEASRTTKDRTLAQSIKCRVKCPSHSINTCFISQCWSAGVCWALSRCLEVPVIYIEATKAWHVSGAFEDIASKLLWVAANNTALRVLVVELDPRGLDGHQALGTHYMSEWVHALAQQLAASRPQLQAFGSRARDLEHIPGHSQPQALDAWRAICIAPKWSG